MNWLELDMIYFLRDFYFKATSCRFLFLYLAHNATIAIWRSFWLLGKIITAKLRLRLTHMLE